MGIPEAEHDEVEMASAAIAALWAVPFNLARMMHDVQIDSMHAWARSFWPEPPHKHEPPSQLEVPEPLEDDFEHDLFA